MEQPIPDLEERLHQESTSETSSSASFHPASHGHSPPPPPSFQRSSQQAASTTHMKKDEGSNGQNQHFLNQDYPFMSPILSMDPYSVPTLPQSPATPKRQNFFEGGSKDLGPAINASDLLEDDMEGSEVSSPFVAFSASTVMNQKKFTNTASLGFGALLTPVRDSARRPPLIQTSSPIRCASCGAYVNLYCLLVPQTGEWRCALCGHGNESGGEYMLAEGEDYSGWPELQTRVVEFHDLEKSYSSASDTALGAPVVLVIDECIDAVYLEDMKTSLLNVLDSLPSSTRIGILTYGATVSAYDLNQSNVASADVFPGDVPLGPDSTNQLLYSHGVYLAPLHTCLPAVHAVLASLRPSRSEIPEQDRKRCMGVAVETALALVRGPAKDLPRTPMKRTGGSSRVVVCAGGPSTVGPGSVTHSEGHAHFLYEVRRARKHMEGLGREARRLEASVDVLFGGTCPVRVPVVHALAKASGGVLVLHDDFRETFASNVRGAVQRVVGVRGTVEVRASAEVAVTRVIGPAEQVAVDPWQGEGSGGGVYPRDSAVTLRMLSVEESQGLALSMELTDDVPHNFLYFQFALRYTSLSHTPIVRIITLRLPTTGSLSTYLRSVDDEVAAVLIGKRTAIAAEGAADMEPLQKLIGERLRDMAKKLGKPVPRSRLHRLPNEMPKLPEMLYHVQRGPLLGHILGHEDEREVHRSLLLNADLDLSLRMLVPQLLLYREGFEAMHEIPPYDLALHSGNALVLDHGTDVFVWMGKDLIKDPNKSTAAEAACLEVVRQITESRFPAPRIMTFLESSSQARFLVARLVPAHKDSISEQETRFPQLRELQQDEKSKLKSKLFPTDEPSFCEWMRFLKLIPPDPSPV